MFSSLGARTKLANFAGASADYSQLLIHSKLLTPITLSRIQMAGTFPA